MRSDSAVPCNDYDTIHDVIILSRNTPQVQYKYVNLRTYHAGVELILASKIFTNYYITLAVPPVAPGQMAGLNLTGIQRCFCCHLYLSVYFVVLRSERTQYIHRLSAVAVISGGGSSEGGV